MVQSSADIEAKEKHEKEQSEKPEVASFTSQLAAHVITLYNRAVRNREESGVDLRLMNALRQRKGVYDADKLAAIRETNGSEIYMLLSEVKCLAAEAWIYDTLMPSGDKPWSIQPTPMPSLPDEEVQAVIQQTIGAAMQDAQAGMPLDMDMIYEYAATLREAKLTALNRIAKERSESMETVMADQMAEGGFAEAFDLFISDLVTFGTGILKGPVLRMKPKRRWTQGGRLIMSESIEYEVEHVSVFDFYPSNEATQTDEGTMHERKRWTVRQLNQLRGLPGVNEKALNNVISRYGEGGRTREFYQDAERRRLEDKSQTLQDNRIEGFESHGPVMGSLLKLWGSQKTLSEVGLHDIEDTKEYEVCVVCVADEVVRIKSNVSPTFDRIYSKANFKRLIGSFWGRGVPESMTDIQDVCNACARAIVNNMGIASGPQVAINDVTRLADGEEVGEMHPWKLWQFKNPAGHTARPIEFFSPDSHVSELMQLFNQFMAMADERTMIPAYAYGNDRAAGAAKTFSGLSTLMNAASRSIKKVISGIDLRVIRPLITRLYDMNMMFHEDPGIKGDAQVVAKGAIGLMLREQQNQLLAQFLAETANPVDQAIIGPERRANARREQVKQMFQLSPDKFIPSEKELRDALAAEAQQQQINSLNVAPGQVPGAQPQEVMQ